MSALRRIFGGVSEASFALLTTRFLTECGFEDELSSGAVGSLALNTVATLRQSLGDTLSDEDDPNTAPYRHVLLLDPTDVEVTVGMVSFSKGSIAWDNTSRVSRRSQVFELGLLDRAKTDVITLSDYADDTSDLQRSQAVASIKAAAEQGRTVLLTKCGIRQLGEVHVPFIDLFLYPRSAAPIASSIFDLLNRHYLKTTKTEAVSPTLATVHAPRRAHQPPPPCRDAERQRFGALLCQHCHRVSRSIRDLLMHPKHRFVPLPQLLLAPLRRRPGLPHHRPHATLGRQPHAAPLPQPLREVHAQPPGRARGEALGDGWRQPQ